MLPKDVAGGANEVTDADSMLADGDLAVEGIAPRLQERAAQPSQERDISQAEKQNSPSSEHDPVRERQETKDDGTLRPREIQPRDP